MPVQSPVLPFFVSSRAKHPVVIIDMQPVFLQVPPSFASSRVKHQPVFVGNALKGCQQLLKEAAATGDTVIFCEYTDYGPSHQSLLDIVGGHCPYYRIEKEKTDGGLLIADIFAKNNISGQVQIGGVSLNMCVKETVKTLQRLLSNNNLPIKIRLDACDFDGDKSGLPVFNTDVEYVFPEGITDDHLRVAQG